MGLTGFNKRRREAALVTKAKVADKPRQEPVSVSPQQKKAEDSEIKPKPVHSTDKKKPKVGINENSKND